MSDTDPSPGEAEPLTVEITALDTREQAMNRVSRAILSHPVLRQHFPAADLWLASFDVDDKEDDPWFVTTVHDTVTGRWVLVQGPLDDPASLTVTPTTLQWPPTEDEFAWAVSILVDHGGELLAGDGTITYRPLPSLANIELADGTVDRVITVGIRSATSEPMHRVVGVRTSDGEILLELPDVPAPSSADCGAPPGPESREGSGANQAQVRVRQGETVLWDFEVVRPRASSGTNGSGVELRAVDYKGQRVLARAHLPIISERYGPDGLGAGCGPAHRHWLHEEGTFGATGTDAVPGFRLCDEPPETVLESGTDGGDFKGVAFWLDGDELVVVSQLRAGWYRWVSEWRLQAGGTIRPRFGCTAARNPCTCHPHVHHAYWRLDFDVLDPDSNVVQEYNDPGVHGTANWHTVRYEVRRHRDPAHGRSWRVRNTRASQGYSIVPGPADGSADEFGAGDLWVLRFHADELDDGQAVTTDERRSRAQLDRLVSGESVERHDLVVWYAVHLAHDGIDPEGGTGGRVGPDLVPYQWKEPPVAQAPYGPLAPPSEEDLQPPARPA